MAELYRRLAEASRSIILQNQSAEGGYIASPNFPVYRYVWLRDGTFTAYALDVIGERASSRAFYDWTHRVITARKADVQRVRAQRRPVAILPARYRAGGEPDESDWPNFQLDGYGAWLWGLACHLSRMLDADAAEEVDRYLGSIELTHDYLSSLWLCANYDCWEENGEGIHASTLACIYGGLEAMARLLARRAGKTADLVGERAAGLARAMLETAAEVKAFVESALVRRADGRVARLVKRLWDDQVDASCLWAAVPFGMFAPDSEVAAGTAAEIERTLKDSAGGVMRYACDTYYGGGRWIPLAGFLGWYYASVGLKDAAQRELAWMARQANSRCELPEQVGGEQADAGKYGEWLARWGPVATPLLWSHAMYLILWDACGRPGGDARLEPPPAQRPRRSTEPGGPRPQSGEQAQPWRGRANDRGGRLSLEVEPDKAQYRPGEQVVLSAVIANNSAGPAWRGTVTATVSHLEEAVATLSPQEGNPVDVGPGDRRRLTFRFDPGSGIADALGPEDDLKSVGFGVVVTASAGTTGVADVRAYTAFDYAWRWAAAPRYGFASEFPPPDVGAPASQWADAARERWRVNTALHLNVVQFYDWIYRHHRLLPAGGDVVYTDPLGRTLSLESVREQVGLARRAGICPMAYVAVYAAQPEFADDHPDWVARSRDGAAFTLGNLVTIMDASGISPWRDHIISQMRAALEEVGFGGVHLDQYGFPRDYVVRSAGAGPAEEGDGGAATRVVDMASAYAELVSRAREALGHDAGIVANAVNAWPLDALAASPQDAIYIEVWPPHDSYGDLKDLVWRAKALGGFRKHVVLAAYVPALSPERGMGRGAERGLERGLERGPDRDAGARAAGERALRLATAAVLANGGFHLVVGEGGRVLTDPYFPKHVALSPAGFAFVRRYADYCVRYGELLSSLELRDVTMTHVGGVNTEVVVGCGGDGDAPVEASPRPEPGKLWTVVTQKPGWKCLHLINLRGVPDVLWAEPKPRDPIPALNLNITWETESDVTAGYVASPDWDDVGLRAVDVTRLTSGRGRGGRGTGGRGGAVVVTVPGVLWWTSLFLKLGR